MGGFLRFCEESGTYKKRRSTDESSVERRPLSVSKNTYLIVSRMEVPMVPFGIAIPKFSAMEAVNLLSLFSIFCAFYLFLLCKAENTLSLYLHIPSYFLIFRHFDKSAHFLCILPNFPKRNFSGFCQRSVKGGIAIIGHAAFY